MSGVLDSARYRHHEVLSPGLVAAAPDRAGSPRSRHRAVPRGDRRARQRERFGQVHRDEDPRGCRGEWCGIDRRPRGVGVLPTGASIRPGTRQGPAR